MAEAIYNFLTAEVDLPAEARSTAPRGIWWEERDGWLCPWRITRHTETGALGYPCGEPVRKEVRS
jgi:hypothetical protein